MQQEMKANLLIHIETNRSFIEEKVYDEFKIECLKEYELKDIDVNKMIGIMQQVFDFGDENPFMKKFFARAQDSIERYIVERYSSAHETENVTLDINMLLDVIFACVEYGFEKQQQQPRVFNEEVPEEIKIEVPQKQQPPSRQKKEPKKQ